MTSAGDGRDDVCCTVYTTDGVVAGVGNIDVVVGINGDTGCRCGRLPLRRVELGVRAGAAVAAVARCAFAAERGDGAAGIDHAQAEVGLI